MYNTIHQGKEDSKKIWNIKKIKTEILFPMKLTRSLVLSKSKLSQGDLLKEWWEVSHIPLNIHPKDSIYTNLF